MEIKGVKTDPSAKFKDEWKKSDERMGMHWNKKKYNFVLYEDGEAVGYVNIVINGGVAELKNLIVREKFRGKGYGKALMEHYIEFAKRQGSHKLVLNTSEKHKEAMGLYSKYGFGIENERPNDRYHLTWYLYSKRIK